MAGSPMKVRTPRGAASGPGPLPASSSVATPGGHGPGPATPGGLLLMGAAAPGAFESPAPLPAPAPPAATPAVAQPLPTASSPLRSRPPVPPLALGASPPSGWAPGGPPAPASTSARSSAGGSPALSPVPAAAPPRLTAAAPSAPEPLTPPQPPPPPPAPEQQQQQQQQQEQPQGALIEVAPAGGPPQGLLGGLTATQYHQLGPGQQEEMQRALFQQLMAQLQIQQIQQQQQQQQLIQQQQQQPGGPGAAPYGSGYLLAGGEGQPAEGMPIQLQPQGPAGYGGYPGLGIPAEAPAGLEAAGTPLAAQVQPLLSARAGVGAGALPPGAVAAASFGYPMTPTHYRRPTVNSLAKMSPPGPFATSGAALGATAPSAPVRSGGRTPRGAAATSPSGGLPAAGAGSYAAARSKSAPRGHYAQPGPASSALSPFGGQGAPAATAPLPTLTPRGAPEEAADGALGPHQVEALKRAALRAQYAEMRRQRVAAHPAPARRPFAR
ncbi:hypothetical protein PAPYR_10172 [Paratrimastix pyriformis]|uniref:Uncharacterized protein n=1 Tax=Paratrimastix pyriformis TaxID=342808 RepID=A0ABQ8U6J8_9EUKA|nr:hypothetical protein PAPYR_10172 [Paratrimastix pyriformis]